MTFVGNWIESEDDALREMWAHGETANAIGRHLGRSKNSVIGRSHRLKLDARKSPIRPRDPNAPPPVRLPVFRLPTLPSLRKPAYNALPPPPEETRELVVRLLTNGRSNVATVEASGLNISEVRKIRKTIEIPTRVLAAAPPKSPQARPKPKPVRVTVWVPDPDRSHKKGGDIIPRVFGSDSFANSEQRIHAWRYGSFLIGKQTERHKLIGKFPTQAEIEAHIAARGVTMCPTAAVAATSATMNHQDGARLAEYRDARNAEWVAADAPRRERHAAASKKRAAMAR